jgi:regulator of protease activity HflC (stomatin/prohibitin superfamily)
LKSLGTGLIIAMIGCLAEWGPGVSLRRAVGYLAASLFIAAAGLISTGLVMQGYTREQADPSWGGSDVLQTPRQALAQRFHGSLEWLGDWLQVVAAILLGGMAMAAVIATWNKYDQGALSLQTQQVFGGLFIVLAFPFLVLERIYANTAPDILTDAPQLERLLRVPLVGFLGFGITGVLLSLGLEWPSTVERAMAVLIGLVSLELVLRGVAAAFLPVAPIGRRRSCADSTIASLLRLTPPTLATFGAAVKRQLGIDLSRSWALAFVRRAALPVGAGMAFVAWCLTGVTALGLDERAVYERLGAPAAILGPGLHIHLPWPLGVLRPIELGVVHEMPIVFSPSGQAIRDNHAASAASVEDIPPANADRLWDTSHPGEASYLIASESQSKQSFQIVDIDLRVVYRVGLSDAAARAAAYATADPEALLRAIAGQLLVRYFAHNTLLDVLVQSRERFAIDFRNELQDGLQRLSTGIEVIAVIIEAIHPPPDAANAYHNVQATEILAHSQVALRQADAIAAIKSAQQNGTSDRNNALAAAAELANQAQAESVLFDADRRAYNQDGRAFLLERWLQHLRGALEKSGLVVIDHRLKGAAAPTIDLRSFNLPGAAGPASPATSRKHEGD